MIFELRYPDRVEVLFDYAEVNPADAIIVVALGQCRLEGCGKVFVKSKRAQVFCSARHHDAFGNFKRKVRKTGVSV